MYLTHVRPFTYYRHLCEFVPGEDPVEAQIVVMVSYAAVEQIQLKFLDSAPG